MGTQGRAREGPSVDGRPAPMYVCRHVYGELESVGILVCTCVCPETLKLTDHRKTIGTLVFRVFRVLGIGVSVLLLDCLRTDETPFQP